MPHDGNERPPKHRFLVLDALRGVAALAVVQFHAVVGGPRVPHGYLAVDFFFLLSGFVISFAYGQRLDNGGSILEFLKARIFRLYPLYLLGLTLGLLNRLIQIHAHQAASSTPQALLVFLFGLTMLPLLAHTHSAYPLNLSMWSLFGELVANVIHAVALRRASTRTLLLWFGACTAMLAAIAATRHTIDVAAEAADLPLAIPRVLLSYLAGMLLHRWWQARQHRQTWPAWPSVLILLAVLFCPALPNANQWLDLGIILFVFPALLLYTVRARPTPRLATPFRIAGLTSYAIYTLHLPLYGLLATYLNHALKHAQPHTLHNTPILAVACLLLITAIAFAVDRFYDLPVRSFLRVFVNPSLTARAIPPR